MEDRSSTYNTRNRTGTGEGHRIRGADRQIPRDIKAGDAVLNHGSEWDSLKHFVVTGNR